MTRNAKRLPVSGLIALVFWLGPASLAQVSDLAPPVLVGFDFSPRTVDTTTGPQTVTVTWHVSDDLSGVNGGCVTFGHGVGGCFNDPVDRISGTDHDGVYQGHLEVPQYAENGTWTIESFSVSDKVGNLIQPSVAELAASGFPTVLVVTGPADTAPPVLVGFDFSPRTVDTTTGSQTVMVTWHVTDDVAGVFGGCVTFGHGVGGCFNDPVDRISGTDHDGVYQGHFEVPRYAPNGTWTIESFSVSDKVSHQIRPTIAELVAQGFPTQLAVTGPEDTTPPVLVGFDFSPRVVDISAGPQTVTLVWHLTDNLAGILGAASDSSVRLVTMKAAASTIPSIESPEPIPTACTRTIS